MRSEEVDVADEKRLAYVREVAAAEAELTPGEVRFLLATLDAERARVEEAERKLASLTRLAQRAVAWAEQDDPEVWVACERLGEALADVAPVAERHDRAVRAKELRRVAGLAHAWLRAEAGRIERGEV